MSTPERIEVRGVRWPEVEVGGDLAGMLLDSADLRDGDVVVLTSKVVSKAEGRHHATDRQALIAGEARRVVAVRGDAVIAQTRHGLVMAAAGVDASNTKPGTALTLPIDPDGTARLLREALLARGGVNAAVIISDTAGRAWRLGQTDFAIGCAGIEPFLDLSGLLDTHGNVLSMTAPALADELAAAADLVKGKVSGRPVAVVSGFGAYVAGPGRHGPGAVALIRDASEDLFGLGAREAAVAAALRDDPVALAHFPAHPPPEHGPFEGLASSRDRVRLRVTVAARPDGSGKAGWLVQIDVRRDAAMSDWLHAGALAERAATLAAAYRLQPDGPPPVPTTEREWRTVAGLRWVVA